jgi:hypothetical protein
MSFGVKREGMESEGCCMFVVEVKVGCGVAVAIRKSTLHVISQASGFGIHVI